MRFAITVQSHLSRGRVQVDTCLQVHMLDNVLVNNPMLEIVKLKGLLWFHVACFSRHASGLQVSLFTMISVEQWRSSIGCFRPQVVGRKCVIDENLCEIRKYYVNCEKSPCNDSKVMWNLLVTALIIALLLIVSRNVELNPGRMKKCLKCAN